MDIYELLDFLKKHNYTDYEYSDLLTENDIKILEKHGYSVVHFSVKPCPCGDWNNDRCRCKWYELANYQKTNKSRYKIRKERSSFQT